MKHIKKILLVSIFIFILIGICGVNAQEASNQTDISDSDDNVYESTDAVDNTLTSDNTYNIESSVKQKNIKTESNSIDITNENYDQLSTYMNQYSTLNFADDFDGKTIEITNGVTITSTSDYTFTNSHFIVNSNDVTINNLNIVNTDNSDSSVIFVNAKNNVDINNNHITVTKTTTGTTFAIELNGTTNSIIDSNTIVVNAYPQAKQWINTSATNYIGMVQVSGIVVDDSDYVDVTNNDITLTNATEMGYSTSTFEGISVRNESTYVSARSNDIDVSNANYTYGITIEKSDRCNATYNTITLTSENYVCGIEVMEDKHILLSYNNITGNAYKYEETNLVGESFAYGFYISANYITDLTQNVTVSYNNINVNSDIVYGIEGYKIYNNNINYNNISVTASVGMGMGFDTTTSTDIENNIIIVTGYNRTLGFNADQVTATTTGIKIQGTLSTLNKIRYNHILINENNPVIDTIYAIIATPINTVKYNYLTSNYNGDSLTANNAVNKNYALGYGVTNNYAYDLTESTNTLTQNTKNLKSDVKTIILTSDNFSNYVTNGLFNENVNEGDIIDIHGSLIGSQYVINLNKALNITSTTNDALLNFNGADFKINSNASGSNITGLTLRDTSITIEANNIIIDNNTISNCNENYAINLNSGINDITISNNALSSINGRADEAINSSNQNYTSKSNVNAPLYITLNDNNYENYLIYNDDMEFYILKDNIMNGDYLSYNVTRGISLLALIYEDFTNPDITVFNTTSYRVAAMPTSHMKIENSVIFLMITAEEEFELELINSTTMAMIYGEYTLIADELSKVVPITYENDPIYGGWQQMGNIFGGKVFESNVKTVYVFSFDDVDEYSQDCSLNDIIETNGLPIISKPTEIIGVTGKIWFETIFKEGSDGSKITNIFFNESVNVTDYVNDIQFINCTFNKGILIPNGNNITLENCVGNVTYYQPLVEESKTIILTSENYDEYITDKVLNNKIHNGDTIDMQGTFNSSLKGLTINKAVNIISSTGDANITLDSGLNTGRTGNEFIISASASGSNISGLSFYNTRITVDGAENVSITNITYTNYMEQIGSGVGGFSIRNDASDVNVTNSTFLTHGNYGHSTFVVAGANNVLIENNNITGETDEDSPVLGKIGNLVYITTYNADGDNYNITIRGNIIDGSKILHDNEIANTFRIQGENITVENNTIIATDYAILEQWVENADVLVKNLIIKDNNLTGAVGLSSTNVTVINNLMDSTSFINSTLINNTIESLTIGHDSVLSGNNITNSIKLDDENITMENDIINAEVNINTSNIISNNVTFNDKVYLNSTASDITFNNCIFNKGLYVQGSNITIENCTGNIIYLDAVIKVDTTEFTIGTTANISASIYFDDKVTLVNKGKVVFKVNGKTVKDANGKIIYAKVVNGTATITDYTIPESWNKEDLYIEAVYSGSNQCDALRSEKVNMTISQKELNLETNDISATNGSNIILTANLNDDTINTGKIVFKINGKTVKDANGKVIYANVVNGSVSVDYALNGYKTGTYTITCIYVGSVYGRMQQNATLIVN